MIKPSSLRKTILLAVALTACASAQAAKYPDKPITIVVANTPGGASDILARLISQPMSQDMGVPVIVENRPGAGQTIGTAEVARAAPDGYTILLATSSSHAINPAVYKKLPYDASKDFSPITTLALSEYALAVPISSPYKSVAELLQGNKRQELRFGSNGSGTTSHLASELFAMRMGTKFLHIPYRSSAQAETDLLGGQIDFLIDNTSTVLQNAQTGKLRVLATTGAKRADISKDFPTMQESGVPDYEVTGWWTVLAPAGTPRPIVDQLNAEIAKIVARPDVKERMERMGNNPVIKSPEETRKFIDEEMKKYADIAKAIHLSID